jgi:hypothetical protein
MPDIRLPTDLIVHDAGNMTLARKTSRRIEVESSLYRWTIASSDLPDLAIVVQDILGRGQRLVSWVEFGVVITPALVRRAILDALSSGWTPAKPGPDFVRNLSELSTSTLAAKQCPCCDYFSLSTRGHDICPVCAWQDDGLDIDKPDVVSAPNHLTVREARANFTTVGACDQRATQTLLDEQQRGRLKRLLRQTPPK